MARTPRLLSFRKRSFAADRLGSFRLLGQTLRPQRFRGEASAFDQRAQLGPDEVGMDAAAKAAIFGDTGQRVV